MLSGWIRLWPAGTADLAVPCVKIRARKALEGQVSQSITSLSLMAEPAWQELLRLRLADRNSKESSFAPIIDQCMYLHSYPPLFFSLQTLIFFRYRKIDGLRNKQNFSRREMLHCYAQ